MSRISKLLENKIRGEAFVDKKQQLQKEFKGGDTLWVEYQDQITSNRLKTFTGICLGKSSKGSDTVVRVRSIVGGVGVVFGFHTLSRNIKDLKVVRKVLRKGGRVKRNDLRYKAMR